MKKFFKPITIVAAIFAAYSIYAKDLDQLVSEFPEEGNSSWVVKYEYIKTNKSDIAKAFNSWKISDMATVPYNKDTTKEQQALADKQYKLFRIYYFLYFEEIKNIPALVGLHLAAFKYCSIPENYNQLKANNWVIDGVKIPEWRIYWCAIAAKDIDTAIKMVPNVSTFDSYWLETKKFVLNECPVTKGITLLEKIENVMLLKNKTANLEDLQNVKRALITRKLSQ